MAELKMPWPPSVEQKGLWKMPPGYFWQQGGVFLFDLHRTNPVRVAHDAVVLTERYIDHHDNVYCTIWYRRESVWKSVVIPFNRMSSSVGYRDLKRAGVPLGAHPASRQFLLDWYSQNFSVLPVKAAVDQGGWLGRRDYAWGDRVIAPREIRDKALLVLSPTLKPWVVRQPVHPKEFRREWRWWIDEVLPTAPYLVLGLAAVGAALLLERLHQPGFVMHIAGITSTGKTTTQMLLASLLGDPREVLGLVQKWSADTDELAEWTHWMKDSVWFLDDATRVSSRTIQDRLYWMTGGAAPGFRTNTRGIIISTSEHMLPVSGGGSARTLSWPTSWLDFGAPVDAWKEHVLRPASWGWALPHLLEKVWQRSDREWLKAWRDHTTSRDNGVLQRWQGYWNSLYVGAMLWPDDRIRKGVIRCENEWWERRGEDGASNA